MKAINKKIVTPQQFVPIATAPIKHHASPLGVRNMVADSVVINQGVKSTQVVHPQPKKFDSWRWAKRFLKHLPKVAAASLLAGCVFDPAGLHLGDDGGQGDGGVPDAGMPDGGDAGDAEVIDPDAAQDAGIDAETDAETPVDDRPTLTWPQLSGLPNNRVFVRWDPPQQIPAGKIIVAYEVTLTVGMSTSTKEVTNTFTALEIVSPNTLYRISVRAKYDDNTYSQTSAEKTVVTDSSLLARYTMDEGSGMMIGDSSANGNHGSLVNFNPSTAWTQGMINTGLLFDGTDDYADVDDSANPGDRFGFDVNEPFTIEAWVKRGALGSWQAVFAKQDLTNDSISRGYWFGFTNNDELYFDSVHDWTANNRMRVHTAAQLDVQDGEYGVAVTYDGSTLADVKLYVDGVEQQQVVELDDNLSDTTSNSAPARIGAAVGINATMQDTSYEHVGTMDEVAVYLGAQPGAVIQQQRCVQKALKNEAGDSSSQPTECPSP